MAADLPGVSVVVPTYERPDLLARCLAALGAQDIGLGGFEICVADDHSGPATAAVLDDAATRLPNLRWSRLERNGGPGAARNRGIALAAQPVVLFVDDDVEAAPDLVRIHAQLHAGTDDRAGVVGLVDWAPDVPVTPFMRWLDTTDLQFAYRTWMQPGAVPSADQAFYTCNLSLKRAILDAAANATARPFDERLRAYEDIELGHRLSLLGFTLEFHPEARGAHLRGMDLAGYCRRMVVVGENHARLAQLHPEVPYPVHAPADGVAAWATRIAAKAGAAVATSIAGRDVYARHCWAEIAHAYAVGLRRGDHRDGRRREHHRG